MSETDDRISEHATEDSGAHPGTRLAEARELLKLSAADVARQLKLSVAQVEALENGQFDRLPGSVFVRGFIRNYARLVKLDPDDLLRAAANSLPQQAPRPEVPLSQDIPFPSTRPRRWRKYFWITAVLVAALAFYELFVSGKEAVVTTHSLDVTPVPLPVAKSKDENLPAPPAVKPTSAPADKMAPSDKTLASSSAAQPAEQPATTMTAEPPKAAPAPEPVKGQPTAEAVPPPQAEPAAPPPPREPAQRQATLVFEDESWVEVRDRDGKVLLFQLNPPGTRQVVSGRPPLSFVIGNAHGVRLTYDDRTVDLEHHTKTDVARLTLE
jgi:cytoskeleton protein RodZ